MSLNVLIAEAQEVLRVGLRGILTADTRVAKIYEATNEGELQQYLASEMVDLIIVNQELLEDISILGKKSFVVLASEPNMTMLKAAYEYGARGYLSVSVSAELLCTTLRSTKKDFLIEPVLAPMVMEYVFDRRMSPAINEALLTPREREIVCLLREGYDRASIAKELCIAEATLKTHIKNIAKKRNAAMHVRQK